MFEFDASKYVVRSLRLKAISQSTIDPRVTFEDEVGLSVKMPVPTAIARRVKQKLKVTKFHTTYPCEIGFYDGRIVSMDVPSADEYVIWKNDGVWESRLSKNHRVLHNLIGDWLYDGQYVYRYTEALTPIEPTNFGSRVVEAFNLYLFGELAGNDPKKHACLAYRNPDNNQWTITSPVTRQSGELFMLSGDSDAFDASSEFGAASDLLLMDGLMFPNLRFVNYAARAISAQFDYAAIEPLGLPLLMIEHRTFNLGGLSVPVQASSPAPFKFTQALAWLIGMFGRVQTLDQLLAVKQSAKMLLTKGSTNRRSEGNKEVGEVDTKQLISSVRDTFASAPLIKFDIKPVNDLVESFEEDE